MGSINYPMCVLVLLLNIASGQVITDLVAAIAEGHDGETCGIVNTDNLICSTLDGEMLNLKKEDRIPSLSVCYEADTETSFLCLANGIKLEETFELPKATRQKRNPFVIFGVGIFVGFFTGCILFCGRVEIQIRQPPKLICAVPIGSQPVYAEKGNDTAVVRWTTATATDMDGKGVSVKQHPTTFSSGQRFSEGRYAIAFQAIDSKSASASCAIEFEVKVKRCGLPTWPNNGNLVCDGYFYGKNCTVECLPGYQLDSKGSHEITCEERGDWSRDTPSCNPVSCKTMPSVSNGRITCQNNDAVYGKTCVTACDDGYKLDGDYFVSCDVNGSWSPPGRCKDDEPPVFNGCPTNIVENIDSPNNTALVKWTIPEGTDNSGEQPIIKEVNGYQPNSRFTAGTHQLEYKIEDTEGNVGQSCWFNLWVRTIQCEPPNLNVEGAIYMEYNCPEYYRFGAECMLSCTSGYPLVGIDKISCLNIDESADPPVLDWIWPDDALGPYCKETVCPDLNTPINGATVCDLWAYGRQCQIQCQDGFDFADGFPEVYVCGTNTGEWFPRDDVPDCTSTCVADVPRSFGCNERTIYRLQTRLQQSGGKNDKPPPGRARITTQLEDRVSLTSTWRNRCKAAWKPLKRHRHATDKLTPKQARLKSDVYYYTDECNSSDANLLEIQNNFIEALNSSDYKTVCVEQPFCRAEFVNVTCGPTQSRRRREINQHYLLKRSLYQFAYVVEFELLVPLNGNDTQSNFQIKAAQLQDMVTEIQNEMDNGHFDIKPSIMHIKNDSFGPGIPEFKCPKGTKPRWSTESCAGCPIGMFMSDNGGICEPCPVGTYQDSINSVSCKTCPIKTSTVDVGSKNSNKCKAICDAGSYSLTGLDPCMKCPTTHYQSSKGQQTCLPCESLKRTLDVGATVATECRDYDVLISHGNGVAINNKTSTTSSLTMLSWMLVRHLGETNDLLRLESFNNYIMLSFQESGDIIFNLNSTLLNTNVSVEQNQWIHLAMVLEYSSQTIQLYRNGEMVFDEITQLLPSNNLLENSGNVVINADIQLSSFHLLNTSLNQASIQQFANSCATNADGSIVDLDDIDRQTDARLVMPSQCDDVDECSSKPCGSHGCINKLGDFECVCADGYTGTLCTIPPDFCKVNSCLNGGTCVSGVSNYTCLCKHGFRGARCDIKIRNGEWSEWTDWALCSKTCDGGVTTRHRHCDNPPPDKDGEPCNGSDTNSKPCNTEKCPECLMLRSTYGLSINCNETESSEKCTVSCRPDLYFASPPLPVYECGRATGYKWNHQTEDNPDARLPTCSDVKPAETVTVGFEGNYDIDPCRTETVSSLNSAVDTKLQNTTCLRSGTCQHTISNSPCHTGEGTGPSQSDSLALHITLTIDIAYEDFGSALQRLHENKTVDSRLLKLVNSVMDLEKTAQEIYNDSESFLQVVVGEQSLSPIQPMGSPSVTVVCPQGSVRLDVFCAVVPQGSYIQGTSVIPCPKGQYQDLAGQSECKICPDMATTSGIGSTSLTDCILGYQTTQSDPGDAKETGIGLVVPIVLGVSVTALVILGAVAFPMVCRRVYERYVVNKVSKQKRPNENNTAHQYAYESKLYSV